MFLTLLKKMVFCLIMFRKKPVFLMRDNLAPHAVAVALA